MRVPRRLSMTRRAEFSQVREQGQSAAGRFFVLATLADQAVDHLKIGLITSRRAGKAVTRNRIRRRFRALLSKHGDKLQPGRYVVMIARYRAGEATFQQLEDDFLRLARQLKILENER